MSGQTKKILIVVAIVVVGYTVYKRLPVWRQG